MLQWIDILYAYEMRYIGIITFGKLNNHLTNWATNNTYIYFYFWIEVSDLFRPPLPSSLFICTICALYTLCDWNGHGKRSWVRVRVCACVLCVHATEMRICENQVWTLYDFQLFELLKCVRWQREGSRGRRRLQKMMMMMTSHGVGWVRCVPKHNTCTAHTHTNLLVVKMFLM